MRERINIAEAISLYQVLRNWRKVAETLTRSTRVRFCADAVQAAVRRHDLGATQ